MNLGKRKPVPDWNRRFKPFFRVVSRLWLPVEPVRIRVEYRRLKSS